MRNFQHANISSLATFEIARGMKIIKQTRPSFARDNVRCKKC